MSGVPSGKGPIRFWFDFASPYAYFSATRIADMGREFGRPVEWRPVLLWAVLKAQGIAAPMEAPSRRDYLLHDMRRSAAFFGLPYVHPARLPVSTHLAARLFHAATCEEPERSEELAQRIFAGFFAQGLDICDEAAMLHLAEEAGIGAQRAQQAMKGPQGRELLESAVAAAVADGVIGSPFFLVDGEAFFGADRLPQLRWLLSRKDKDERVR